MISQDLWMELIYAHQPTIQSTKIRFIKIDYLFLSSKLLLLDQWGHSCHSAEMLRRPRTNSKLPMPTNPIFEWLVSLTLSPRLIKKGKTQNVIRCCWQIGGLATSINSPCVCRKRLDECTIRLGYALFLTAIAFRRVGSA